MARLAYGLLLYVVSDWADESAFARRSGLLRLRIIRSGRITQEDRLALGHVRTRSRVGWNLGKAIGRQRVGIARLRRRVVAAAVGSRCCLGGLWNGLFGSCRLWRKLRL